MIEIVKNDILFQPIASVGMHAVLCSYLTVISLQLQ